LFSRVLYGTAKPIVAVALHLVCRYRVNAGYSSIPDGPLIVACNHLSWIDIPLVGVAVPRRLSFMAKKEYASSRFHRNLIRSFGSFTVDRGAVDRAALRAADEALRKGFALCIFPEGTRSKAFQLIEAGVGTAYVALRHDAHILPVGVAGSENIRQMYEKKRILYRPEVTINIGEPFKLPSRDGKPTREHLAFCTDAIMRRLAGLLPEAYRGVYRDGASSQSAPAGDDAS